MKKIICALALCLAICSSIFAKEDTDSKSSDEYELKRPVRIELGYVPLIGFDAKGAYMFRINDVLRWDVGVDVNFINPGIITTLLLSGGPFSGYSVEVGYSLNILAMADFWFWDFYTSYGLGVGINTVGKAAFIPFDLRIGWEPGARKNNRVQFKLEAGLFVNTYGSKTNERENGITYQTTQIKYIVSPKMNIGLAVRF